MYHGWLGLNFFRLSGHGGSNIAKYIANFNATDPLISRLERANAYIVGLLFFSIDFIA